MALKLLVELWWSLRRVRKLLEVVLALIKVGSKLSHGLGLCHGLSMTIAIGVLMLRERGVLNVHHSGSARFLIGLS